MSRNQSNNNKALGFTLIELLAVIVILAIIATIATPIILSIINDANKSTMLRSADFYLNGVEISIANGVLENKKMKNSTYVIMSDGNICLEYDSDNKCSDILEIEVDGEIPSSGKITVSEGQIKDFQITYKNKTITQSNNKLVFSYKEKNNIEVPDLYNGTLTPVVYDGNNWVVADESSKWYNYEKQEWANAVILDSSVDKKVGDIVTVDGESPEVLAMLVWIPRYEYKIEGTYGKGGTSATLPGEVEVNFINVSEKKASEGYIVHPAFTFGDREISGIWVGKFELSHNSNAYLSLGCTTEQCAGGNNLRILPNVVSLKYNTVSSFFFGIRSMSQENNVFGIDKSITDTHMMKNNEWGAVAYLSQSKYGKYGNSLYVGRNKEVYVNNGNRTGRSGGSYGGNTAVNTVYLNQESAVQYTDYGFYTYDGYLLSYNTNIKTDTRDMSKIASTTGNIYGVYDMSGGSLEFVMGVFENSNGELWSGNSFESNSGFKGKVGDSGDNIEGLEWPEEKYYNVYKASDGGTIDVTKACNGSICYGEALTETMGWHEDPMYLVSAAQPWFYRGGAAYSDKYAGIFYSGFHQGRAYGYSTRVVFSPAT